MKLSRISRSAGFTLIELLCVIVIIAVLSSVLLPAVGRMSEQAQNVKCQNNLKQIAVTALAAAQDHNNTFIPVEFDPEDPAYTADQVAKPLTEVFKPYGLSADNLKCPADVKLNNRFASLGSSYMWKPQTADEETNAITIYGRRVPRDVPQSRVQLATDYDLVHFPDQAGARRRMNVVYADGHVVSR